MTDTTIDVAALVERLRHLVALNEPQNGGPYQGYAAQQFIEAASEAATALQSQADALAEARRERDALVQVVAPGDKRPALIAKIIIQSIENEGRATNAEASLATMREALEKAEAVLRNSDPISTTDGGKIPETTTGEAAIAARRALGGSNAE